MVLLASTCINVSGADRKAMGVLTAQVRTRSYTAAGALENLDRAMGGWVVKLRMIGDRSSELAQSLTDLIVLFFFNLSSFLIGYTCACRDRPSSLFCCFLVFMGITIDPLRNVFLGIVCKQAHCRTPSSVLRGFTGSNPCEANITFFSFLREVAKRLNINN